jgi:hypothetical protein
MKFKITLQDHGQDFLRFVLRDGRIAEANLQGWIWDGREILNQHPKPGDLITFDDGRSLSYPIETVTELE